MSLQQTGQTEMPLLLFSWLVFKWSTNILISWNFSLNALLCIIVLYFKKTLFCVEACSFVIEEFSLNPS